mgnify:CR=1 FL=1
MGPSFRFRLSLGRCKLRAWRQAARQQCFGLWWTFACWRGTADYDTVARFLAEHAPWLPTTGTTAKSEKTEEEDVGTKTLRNTLMEFRRILVEAMFDPPPPVKLLPFRTD